MSHPSNERACYVYGIVRAGACLEVEVPAMDPRWPAVYAVREGGIAAVVSDVARERIHPTRANLIAHERVNGAVLRAHTLIPMSFGSVCMTREDVVKLLRSGQDAFGEALARLDGKVELGLKVHGPTLDPEGDAAAILGQLREVSAASTLCTGCEPDMLLNAAFLVRREREEAFDRRVEDIAACRDEWRFRRSGPWPPYNFVHIRLRLEGARS